MTLQVRKGYRPLMPRVFGGLFAHLSSGGNFNVRQTVRRHPEFGQTLGLCVANIVHLAKVNKKKWSTKARTSTKITNMCLFAIVQVKKVLMTPTTYTRDTSIPVLYHTAQCTAGRGQNHVNEKFTYFYHPRGVRPTQVG